MLRPRPNLSGVIMALVGIAYPFLIYFGLKALSPLIIGGALIAFLLVRVVIGQREKKTNLEMIALGLTLGFILLLLFIDAHLAVKAYPVTISLSLAAVFAYSLFSPPCIIERFARLVEPKLNDRGVRYTRNVTWIWIGFFLVNSAISGWLALNGTLETWTLYNGFISYLLIGALFAGELGVRQIVKKHHVTEA